MIQGIETAAPESENTELRKSLLSSVEKQRKAIVVRIFTMADATARTARSTAPPSESEPSA